MTFIGHSAPGLSVVPMLLVMMLFVCTVDGQAAGQSWLYQIDCEISSTKTVEWAPNVKKMGYFDVQGAVDDDGEKGHWWMSLGSRSSAKPKAVITSIFISTSNTATSTCPAGFYRRCWWDVDSAIGTDGKSGHWATGLCIRYEPFKVGMVAVNDVVLKASSSKVPPSTPAGYRRRGFWDVSGDSYSYFDKSKGHWMMGIYARGARVGTPPARPARQPMVYQVDCEISSTKTVEWDPMNYNGKKLGYFDVQSAVDDDGEKGHWWMSLGTKSSTTPPSVITDLQIRAGNTATTNCPSGYTRRCWWDVDSGVGTDGRSGHWAIALCLRSASYRAGVVGISDVVLKASSSKVPPSTPSGYVRRGFWDVSGESYSYYDNSRGHWMMGIYARFAKIAPLPTPAPTPSPTDLPTPAPTPSPTDLPTPAPTPSPTNLPTPAPTPSPTNLPTPAPTPSPTDLPTPPSCKAKRVHWGRRPALENCYPIPKSKNKNAKSCKSKYQGLLETSLANELYYDCKAKCVYDYNALVEDEDRGFFYKKKNECYKYVTKGGCFNKKRRPHYKQAQERAKMLCTE